MLPDFLNCPPHVIKKSATTKEKMHVPTPIICKNVCIKIFNNTVSQEKVNTL
jgi:hypothetical protein